MSKKKFLTREQILKADDIRTEEVYVELWGGWVCVTAMTGIERDAFEKEIVKFKGKQTITKDNIRARLVAKTIVDPEGGVTLFTNADIEALGKKSAYALDLLFDVASRLSKVSDDDIDELVENLKPTPGDGSFSDSAVS